MKKDPYAVGFEPDKFRMAFLGREDGWYVIKVYERHHDGLHACMLDRDLFDWLFEEVGPARYLMQRTGVPIDKEFPRLRLAEGDGFNTIILLKRFADVVAFDQHFTITGMKALMES